MPTGMDCYNVGPDSRCFCGHSYKAHAWYNTSSKRVHCRCPGCKCKGFDYIPGHGSFWPRCVCKHGHERHRKAGVGVACDAPRCGCTAYHCAMSCACGYHWDQHATVIQNKRERMAAGKRVSNLAGGDASLATAACGAVTDFTSLVSGVERAQLGGAAVSADTFGTVPQLGAGPARHMAQQSALANRLGARSTRGGGAAGTRGRGRSTASGSGAGAGAGGGRTAGGDGTPHSRHTGVGAGRRPSAGRARGKPRPTHPDRGGAPRALFGGRGRARTADAAHARRRSRQFQ